MSISKQHDYYERKLDELLKEMPDYVVKYVDAKQDIRSPLTLFNYVRDHQEFFNWLIAEGIVPCESIRDITPGHLENLSLEEASNYFKFIARKKYKVSKNDEMKKVNPKTVNRHKSSLRSLFKYLMTKAELENREPYFHRNVMQKIQVKKVSETFNERAKNITEKIFINDQDIDFLAYAKDEYEHSLSSTQKNYFKRNKERDYTNLSLFLGSVIRVNELSNLRIKDVDLSSKEISVIRKGNKKDTVSVTPSSFQDIKGYLDIRTSRYKGKDDENEFVFIKLFKGEPLPLTNRAIENIVYKYTKSFVPT